MESGRADRIQGTEKFSIFLCHRAFDILLCSLTLTVLQSRRMAAPWAFPLKFAPPDDAVGVRGGDRMRLRPVFHKGARDEGGPLLITSPRHWTAQRNPSQGKGAGADRRDKANETGRGGEAGFSTPDRQSGTVGPCSESNPELRGRSDHRADRSVRRVSARLAKSAIFNGFGDFAGLPMAAILAKIMNMKSEARVCNLVR